MPLQMTAPWLNPLTRRTVKAPINPLDKSTIISIFPKPIHEVKHTLDPGSFHVPPGSAESPSVLVIGPSSWWKEIDENQPLLEIPVSSIQVADSIVKDYINTMLMSNAGDATPGVTYVPGQEDLNSIKSKYPGLIPELIKKQMNWYRALVKLGDNLWARTNGNPIAISDDMRIAARELKLEKEWIKDYQTVDLIKCIACGNLRDPRYPLCIHCKTVIDRAAYDKLGLKPMAS
jgi:hypothetical protein